MCLATARQAPASMAGVGCHSLQGIFPTQGSNPHLLHWRADSSPLSHLGSPHLSWNLPTSSQSDTRGLLPTRHDRPSLVGCAAHSLRGGRSWGSQAPAALMTRTSSAASRRASWPLGSYETHTRSSQLSVRRHRKRPEEEGAGRRGTPGKLGIRVPLLSL